MCLVVAGVAASTRYRLLIAANRDEQHARPTAAAAWWRDAPQVLGGRDLSAGGTWLAVDRRGRFAAVTNVREGRRPTGLRSRGSLVAEFLLGDDSAARYAAGAVHAGEAFGPFNLLVFDGHELHFASNRAPAARLAAGLHAFSNAPPGGDWPKTVSAVRRAAPLIDGIAPVEPLFALLAERDVTSEAELRHQRAHFVVGDTYGTRCSTVVLLDAGGRATFVERSFDSAGVRTGEVRESFALEP